MSSIDNFTIFQLFGLVFWPINSTLINLQQTAHKVSSKLVNMGECSVAKYP